MFFRIETPKPLSLECTPKLNETNERPAEVTTSEPWSTSVPGVASAAPTSVDSWPVIAAEAYLQAARHKSEGENLPSSTDSRN